MMVLCWAALALTVAAMVAAFIADLVGTADADVLAQWSSLADRRASFARKMKALADYNAKRSEYLRRYAKSYWPCS